MEQMLVTVDAAELPDAELDQMTAGLRRDLLELPVGGIVPVLDAEAPAGARGDGIMALGTFVVLLNSSAVLLTSLVSTPGLAPQRDPRRSSPAQAR